MTAAGGIDISGGTLVINPGASGDGGSATVNKGAAAAAGCPGGTGASSTAKGGNAGDNSKRLFVRGNVAGLANVSIGALRAGAGGPATANACDGGPGDPCCNGGPGGQATATGGKGGNASLNVGGLPVTVDGVFGGRGGDATATGGNGGDGGDCKFADAGDGGAGGGATATGGDGGTAANSAGPATGGDGGDATATGGTGGAGGDSVFGAPGAGGAGGGAAATAGAGGAGPTAGSPGEANPNDGPAGPGGNLLPPSILCFPFGFVTPDVGVILPGIQVGPVFSADGATQLGTMPVEFRNVPGASYQAQNNPDLIVVCGELDLQVSKMQLTAGPPDRPIGGLRIAPLFGTGINQTNPLLVQALDANGQVIGTQAFAEIPDNLANHANPTTIEAVFNVSESVPTFRIVVPPTASVAILWCCLLDP